MKDFNLKENAKGFLKRRYKNGGCNNHSLFGFDELINLMIEYNKHEQKNDFGSVVRPVIKYLCENHNPHHTIVITSTTAELSEGKKCVSTTDYVKD